MELVLGLGTTFQECPSHDRTRVWAWMPFSKSPTAQQFDVVRQSITISSLFWDELLSGLETIYQELPSQCWIIVWVLPPTKALPTAQQLDALGQLTPSNRF